MTEFAEAALRYANLGLAVIPLHPRQKIPMFQNWPTVATNDAEMISRWWKQTPNANVGIATGERSRVFVLDVDPKNGGRDSYDTLITQHGRFPDTWQQITGSQGMHFFFRYPAFRVLNVSGLFQGIDIRGEGGQVVAPPSIHPSGSQYTWDGLYEIEQTPIADAPLWLLDLLYNRTQRTHSDRFPLTDEKIPKGVQHDTLVSLAGMFRKLGLTAEEIFPSLQMVNEKRCTDPGPEMNIRKIADSMMRYQPAEANLARVAGKIWRMSKALEIEQKKRDDERQIEVIDGLTVYRSPKAENHCVVEDLLFNGLTIFAGRPKLGKSWMMLQLALSVASGGKFLGKPVLRPGGVIYLALEESSTRTSGRMQRLQGESPMLQNIGFTYRLKGSIQWRDQIDKLLEDRKPNLMIIDTFLKLASVNQASQQKNLLRHDYAEIDILHDLSTKHSVSIVLVHHLRKSTVGETALDAVAGSTGVTAAADSIWTLRRDEQAACRLTLTGRDSEDMDLAVNFNQDPIGWEVVGTGAGIAEARDTNEILDLLRHENKPIAGTKIASLLRMNANRVRHILYDLQDRRVVGITKAGMFYALGRVTPEVAGDD